MSTATHGRDESDFVTIRELGGQRRVRQIDRDGRLAREDLPALASLPKVSDQVGHGGADRESDRQLVGSGDLSVRREEESFDFQIVNQGSNGIQLASPNSQPFYAAIVTRKTLPLDCNSSAVDGWTARSVYPPAPARFSKRSLLFWKTRMGG